MSRNNRKGLTDIKHNFFYTYLHNLKYFKDDSSFDMFIMEYYFSLVRLFAVLRYQQFHYTFEKAGQN